MITKLQRENKSSNPKIKNIEEKRLKLLHCPLTVLTIPATFTPKAPQEARGHHLLHIPTSEQFNYSTWGMETTIQLSIHPMVHCELINCFMPSFFFFWEREVS
jgi:hypothetical protein